MRGAVLLVVAALGVATIGSILLWMAPKLFRRRSPSFNEQLSAMAPRPGERVGPAGGVSAPTPITAEPATAEPATAEPATAETPTAETPTADPDFRAGPGATAPEPRSQAPPAARTRPSRGESSTTREER